MNRWRSCLRETSPTARRTPISNSPYGELIALATTYYEGMVYGRANTLRAVFEHAARFQGVRDGEQVRRGLDEFVDMVGSTSDVTVPPEQFRFTVESIDVTGPLAVLKVRDRFRGRTYVDYLTAVHKADGWCIVNKAFTTVDDADCAVGSLR